MARLVYLHLWLFVFLLLTPLAWAQSHRRVRLDAAATVYTQPSFSAAKLEQLQARSVVTLGTAKIVGSGGLGVFYKVKTPSGKVGYIADSDAAGTPVIKANSPTEDAEDPTPPPLAKAYSARAIDTHPRLSSWGLSFGAIDYSEAISGQTYHQPSPVLGLRHLSSGWSLGLFIDFGLHLSPMAPRFLSKAGATGKTTGSLVFAEALLLIPVVATESTFVFFGGGLAPIFTTYKTNFSDGPKSTSSYRTGTELDLGLMQSFVSWALRLDLKYFLETKSYPGVILSLQFGMP